MTKTKQRMPWHETLPVKSLFVHSSFWFFPAFVCANAKGNILDQKVFAIYIVILEAVCASCKSGLLKQIIGHLVLYTWQMFMYYRL